MARDKNGVGNGGKDLLRARASVCVWRVSERPGGEKEGGKGKGRAVDG